MARHGIRALNADVINPQKLPRRPGKQALTHRRTHGDSINAGCAIERKRIVSSPGATRSRADDQARRRVVHQRIDIEPAWVSRPGYVTGRPAAASLDAAECTTPNGRRAKQGSGSGKMTERWPASSPPACRPASRASTRHAVLGESPGWTKTAAGARGLETGRWRDDEVPVGVAADLHAAAGSPPTFSSTASSGHHGRTEARKAESDVAPRRRCDR